MNDAATHSKAPSHATTTTTLPAEPDPVVE
jgi:hypothetical protein